MGELRRSRCPYCDVVADRYVYGMPDGPPGPGERIGGCIVTPGRDPEYACPECDAEWRLAGRVRVIVSTGRQERASRPPRCLFEEDVDSIYSSVLAEPLPSSEEGLEEHFDHLAKGYGLSRSQIQMLWMVP